MNIAITKVITIFVMTKKTMNSATKPLIPGNAREAIDKILKVVNIFGIGMDSQSFHFIKINQTYSIKTCSRQEKKRSANKSMRDYFSNSSIQSRIAYRTNSYNYV